MPNLIIPVGIPGCGKSTYAEALTDYKIRSTDAIRRELNEGKYVHSNEVNARVFPLFHERILDDLWAGRDVFADATNLTRDSREKLYKVASQAPGVKVWVVLFKNNDQAIYRNRQRDPESSHVVPEDAMQRMLAKYERTLMELPQEKFDRLIEISGVR